jgi:hypothetical protein
MFGRVALALPAGSKFSERDLVADDVVVGDEEVVADSADRLGLIAPSAQRREVRGEIGALGSDGGPRAFGELVSQPVRAWAGSSRAAATG